MKKVLLLEPNYKNKYPPMGLMKLAMYHRLQGDWDVVFYKGDLKDFVVKELTRRAIRRLTNIDSDYCWEEYTPEIFNYVKTCKVEPETPFEHILENSLFGEVILDDYHRYYRRNKYFDEKPWDRVCVTTLFTFYAKITYETIEFAKKLVGDPSQLMVGGIMASVVPQEIEKKTGVKPFEGCIYDKSILGDPPLDVPVDALPLDYSILDEIDYQYPETNAYYGYTTRGCVNRCPFCAVPKLEPHYQDFIPLKPRVDVIRERFGEQRNLLLLDNNVFASKRYDDIIDDIRKSGFELGAKYTPTNPLEIVIKQLEDGWNDRAYIRKGVKILNEHLDKLKGEAYQDLYSLMSREGVFHDYTATKEGVLEVCKAIREDYQKLFLQRRRPVRRYVDFNQGVDARLASEDKIRKLSTVAIRPIRIAFDDWKLRKFYVQAIYYANKYHIENASNYILYNFRDEPIELYNRLALNVDLSKALGISIYSFPMKYHPIMDPEWFENRDYLGEKWTRKEIRTIQTILNATKGKVGTSRSFFYAAFGHSEEAFRELLRMPEDLILNRYDAEAAGIMDQWRDAYHCVPAKELAEIDRLVSGNVFVSDDWGRFSKRSREYLKFYLYEKKDIPIADPETKEMIRERHISLAPSDISDVCRELLDSVRK